MNLGQRIRELRYARHVSYKETKASRGHLSRIECGHQAPSLEMLERLSAEFEMGLEVLLGSDERFYTALILEEEFVRTVIPFLRQLSEEQKKLILRTLEAAPKLPADGRRKSDRTESLILERYRSSIGSKGLPIPSRT